MFYIGRFSGDGPVMVLLKCCILQQIGSEKDQVKCGNCAKGVGPGQGKKMKLSNCHFASANF